MSAMYPSPQRHHIKGVSLIELMIAMAIGLVLVAAIGFTYLGAKNSFRSQQASSAMQENARYAFEFMGNDIRMAGFTGSTTVATVTEPVAMADIPTPPISTSWKLTPTDIKNYPLLGYINLAANDAATGRLAGTNALTVIHADTDNGYTLDTTVIPNPSATTFTLSSASAPGTAGGYYVCADFTQATAFAKTTTSTSTVVTTDPIATVSPTLCATGVCKVYPIQGATYFIRNNTAGQPSLYRLTLQSDGTTNAQELVQGVTNMQISYGVGTDVPVAPATRDTDVNLYWTADQVTAGTDGATTMPAGTAIDYWKRVNSVRITLTLTSLSTEKVSTTGSQLAKTFTATFAVRNRII